MQLHDGMHWCVCADACPALKSLPLGVKQGWVIAPVLFFIFFEAMLNEALLNCDEGTYIRFRTDGNIFNLSKLHSKANV